MLEPRIRDIAQAKNFAVLTVIPADGHPMTHVMWIDADDEHLLINTQLGRAKAAAMDRDPRVTVTIWEHANPYHYVEVRGRVVGSATGAEAAEHIDKLSAKYVGGPYTLGPKDNRIVYRVEPLRQRMDVRERPELPG
jgi:PPOX class probable F420-dependent enzyme